MVFKPSEVVTIALIVFFSSLWLFMPDTPKQPDTKEQERNDIKDHSKIVRICKNGTSIWRYKDEYWVRIPNLDAAWLDPQTPQEKFCD